MDQDNKKAPGKGPGGSEGEDTDYVEMEFQLFDVTAWLIRMELGCWAVCIAYYLGGTLFCIARATF